MEKRTNMANTVDHSNKGPQRAARFFGLDPDGEEFRPVDRVFGPDDPNSDLCSEPLKGLACAMHDSDWRLKYPIPLPEEPKPRCKVILEDVAPPECPLIKAIREQDEKDKNTETKPNGTNTMISNPQKKTPIERIHQIARVGAEKKLYSEALTAIVELL